jgi:hypothetical protein
MIKTLDNNKTWVLGFPPLVYFTSNRINLLKASTPKYCPVCTNRSTHNSAMMRNNRSMASSPCKKPRPCSSRKKGEYDCSPPFNSTAVEKAKRKKNNTKKEAQRSTKKHKEAQRSTEKHKEAQRSTKKKNVRVLQSALYVVHGASPWTQLTNNRSISCRMFGGSFSLDTAGIVGRLLSLADRGLSAPE